MISLPERMLRLERSLSLGELGSIRKMVPIQECGELLVEIPYGAFSFEDPHPYKAAGAVYPGCSPFHVREGVLHRLHQAQDALHALLPGYRLHIFDAYRPVSVQAYMVNYTRRQLAQAHAFNPDALTDEQEAQVMAEVFKVWAKPSLDRLQPPPHSTGGAIDLTIVNEHGFKLDMGSDFDEPSERILPHHYWEDPSPYGRQIHQNREYLYSVMTAAGFMRLTHEWWHFSYGDQMWALLKHMLHLEPQAAALYGAADVANAAG